MILVGTFSPSSIHAPASNAHAGKYHGKGKHEGQDLLREIFVCCLSHSFCLSFHLYFVSSQPSRIDWLQIIYINTILCVVNAVFYLASLE